MKLTSVHKQAGSATMTLTLAVVVVVLVTVGAAFFYLRSHAAPPAKATSSVKAPLSPYDPLDSGSSNDALKSNVLNVASGMHQEELHLQGVDSAINDQQVIVNDQ